MAVPQFKRRYVTPFLCHFDRGLKPTATINPSLREASRSGSENPCQRVDSTAQRRRINGVNSLVNWQKLRRANSA